MLVLLQVVLKQFRCPLLFRRSGPHFHSDKLPSALGGERSWPVLWAVRARNEVGQSQKKLSLLLQDLPPPSSLPPLLPPSLPSPYSTRPHARLARSIVVACGRDWMSEEQAQLANFAPPLLLLAPLPPPVRPLHALAAAVLPLPHNQRHTAKQAIDHELSVRTSVPLLTLPPQPPTRPHSTRHRAHLLASTLPQSPKTPWPATPA